MDTRRRAELAMSLMASVGATPHGSTVLVPAASTADAEVINDWCQGTGNTVLAVHADSVEVFRGRLTDPRSSLPPDRLPGYRLWMYTNFHCNLACDYCCVLSSPKADPRTITAAMAERIFDEGAACGVREIYLTGGEPFLNPDIAQIANLAAAAAPTVLLSNGMLYRGARLKLLEQMPREGFTLQVSVDSPTPDVHDLHRGAGSWAKAIAGICTAKSLGFRVRLAVTVQANADQHRAEMAALSDDLGLDTGEMIVRPIAAQGAATDGIVISRATVVPEVCVTGDGIYWHPVAAADPVMRVTDSILPLEPAIRSIADEFLAYRRAGDVLAANFPCA